MERHPVEAGVPQGSPVSPILFTIYMSGLIKLVEERVPIAKVLSCVDHVGLVVTGNDINQVVRKLKAWATVSIDWVERRELQFDTAKPKQHSSPTDEATRNIGVRS